MTIVVPVPITAGPPVPNSNDPEVTFDQQFEASLTWQRDTLAPGANALAAASYSNALDAKSSAEAAHVSELAAAASALNASSTSNFKGEWSSLTGALAPPASVYHNGLTWNLLTAIPNVTLEEPTLLSTVWRANNTVFPVVPVDSSTITMLAGYEYEFRFPGKITATMPAQVEGAGVVVTVCNGRTDNVLLRASPSDSFMGKTPDDITLVTAGRWALRALFYSWRGF